MCGIIGYIGEKNAVEVLVDGLKKLEYRGYDSAGIALSGEGQIQTFKAKGKVENLEKKVSSRALKPTHCGIGHTRWATHGEPSDVNAHPHQVGKVTLVHNGIIENYLALKNLYHPYPLSETDTEIAAAVINAMYNGDPVDAIFKAVRKFHGSYALCVLFSDIPDTIFAIRRGSPMVVAVGENETFLASDIPAILSYTKRYYIPSKDDLAIISPQGVRFVDCQNRTVEKTLKEADWDQRAAQKGGFEHYMLKEIHEQPAVIEQTVMRYKTDDRLFAEETFDFTVKGRIHIIACGSAMHAGLLGKYAIEQLARIPTTVHIASEFRYDNPILSPDDLVIAISQSGETADTLAAVRLAKEYRVRTLGIVNVRASSLSRIADHTLYTLAGPEIAVATTKAFLCQTCLLQMLAVHLAADRLTSQERQDYMKAFELLPHYVKDALSFDEQAKEMAERYKGCEHVFFMGRGQDYYLCSEASLKLKEISYIHSEAYAAGELKHGTISLISENTPVIAVMSEKSRLPKTASNLKEVKARGAFVTVFTYDEVDTSDFADSTVLLLQCCELTVPLVAAVKCQLLSYYVAKTNGCEIDQPRNLAKSVTVE